ncbi:CaiB/BaiF CoA transferase family protein [Monashia sp. NPDC004114]
MNGQGPLAGLRVVDLTHALAGPYCTMMLADLGADVLKIESTHGDLSRAVGPFVADAPQLPSGYFQSINRGKRSVVLDLKRAADVDILLNLTSEADVLVENFSAGVMERLGLSYEHLRERNPALVYATLRGFGDPAFGDSPYANWPAMDVVIQAMAGPMSITGTEDGTPIKMGPGVADIFPGLMLSLGIVSGVLAARATGQGQHVDVAMYDAVLSLCERLVYQHSMTGEVPGPEGNKHPLLCPFDVLRARDGWVSIAAPTQPRWRQLCAALGLDDLVDDPRFATNVARVANRDELRGHLEAWTTQRDRTTIVAELGGTVPIGPVSTIADIMTDEHVARRNMLVEMQDRDGRPTGVTVAGQPLKFSATPAAAAPYAPVLDEDGDAVRETFGTGAWGR